MFKTSVVDGQVAVFVISSFVVGSDAIYGVVVVDKVVVVVLMPVVVVVVRSLEVVYEGELVVEVGNVVDGVLVVRDTEIALWKFINIKNVSVVIKETTLRLTNFNVKIIVKTGK